jgi:ElaB/YqjD/DUF883 family membrane-anchored ribosome-binding protein
MPDARRHTVAAAATAGAHDERHADAAHSPTSVRTMAGTPPTPPAPEEARRLRAELAATFKQTAEVLEQSAQLAEDDAQRKALQGDAELEVAESRRADWARAAAQKARASAARLDSPRSH